MSSSVPQRRRNGLPLLKKTTTCLRNSAGYFIADCIEDAGTIDRMFIEVTHSYTGDGTASISCRCTAKLA